MTAKDYLKQFKVNDKVIWVMDNGEKKSDFCLSDMMEEYANHKTRHIAEQAVGEVCEENPYKKLGDMESYSRYREGIEAGADAVLTRINELTQGESHLTQTNEDK